MRSNPDEGSAGSSASPSSSTTRPPTSSSPAPARVAGTPTTTDADSKALGEDANAPIEIAPQNRAEARQMTERIVRRTGRPVVIKEGHPGLDEPKPAEAIIPLTGDAEKDRKAALDYNSAQGGTAPKTEQK